MTLTAQEVARLRWLWGEHARQALALATDPSHEPEGFRARAHDALKWLSPLDDYADAFVLFGFARLAAAHLRAKVTAQAERAPALRAVAELVLRMLGDAPKPPGPQEPPPRLPFRADIDG